MNRSNTDNRIGRQQGVTLVELLIVVGIVSVVSAVLMFNYSDFNNNVSIRNLAQEMGLAVRKAQTYATSVQAINNTSQNTNVFPSYGMSFSMNAATSDTTLPTNKRFVLFADIPPSTGTVGDKIYTSNRQCGVMQEGSECVETFGISTGDRIVRLCTSEYGCSTTATANVIFARPAPDAYICIVQGSACTQIASNLDVVVQSQKGRIKTVRIWNTGQISVQ